MWVKRLEFQLEGFLLPTELCFNSVQREKKGSFKFESKTIQILGHKNTEKNFL